MLDVPTHGLLAGRVTVSVSATCTVVVVEKVSVCRR